MASSKPDRKLFYLAVGNNIKKYRTMKNESLQTIAEKVGLTKKTIQRYENGEIKVDMDRLADIAEALGVKVHHLLNGAQAFLGLNLEQLSVANVPILGAISCGNGSEAHEEILGYEPTPQAWLNDGDYFYLRACGDSMSGARINDGDLTLIRRQAIVSDGDIAAVLIDGQAYLKRIFIREGRIILQSENPKYPPIIYDLNSSDCRILGKLKRIVIVS